MSSIDSFSGLEGGAGMDPSAFEKFQEQMSENSAVIAALTKAQAAQAKTDNNLVQIIVKFLQNSTHRELVNAITKLLEQDVPALLILAMLFLIDEDVRSICKISFEIDADALRIVEASVDNRGQELIVQDFSFSKLPIKARLTLDVWMKTMYDALKSNPNKMLTTLLMPGTEQEDEISVRQSVVDALTIILLEFLDSQNLPANMEITEEFAHFTISGLIKRLKDDMKLTSLEASMKDKKYM